MQTVRLNSKRESQSESKQVTRFCVGRPSRLLAVVFNREASGPVRQGVLDSMGTRTASGERMNANALAAAHRTLPFGTRVRVDNLRNGRSVVVRINDRGPFVGGRVIDVTRGAAEQLGMIRSGTARVRVTVVDGGKVLRGCS
jgi:rare lipoprotein A